MAGNGANRLKCRSGANERLIVAFACFKAAGPLGHFARKAVVPPNLTNLPKLTFRILMSADLDSVGGHPHHPCHHSSIRVLRRHEHADP